MKTKIIPFDVQIAKGIQDGKIKGRILNNLNHEVRIVCFDREDAIAPIIALFKYDGGEGVMYVRDNGDAVNCRDVLVLEVQDTTFQLKPFDKVLVRDFDYQEWHTTLYESCGNDGFYVLHGNYYRQCIPFEGNENLVGTTDKPKEDRV